MTGVVMENLQGGTLALEHRYQIDATVGQVALRTLYRGTQHPFEKSVWICTYDVLEGASESSIEERIKASAQAASALEHEGVLRTVDYGEIEAGIPFVVLERVAMPTLASRLESEGALPLPEAIALVTRLADVLERAHDRKVVHGALGAHCVYAPARSPERARVGFFGLGLRMSEIRKIEGCVPDFETVAPLAPEVFVGKEPDVRSDVYALGALAYEALSGQHPYFEDRDDISSGLISIQKKETPVRALTEFGVEKAVWEVVARAISWEPSKRWVGVSEFAEELNSVASPKKAKPEEAPFVDEQPEVYVPRRPDDSQSKEPGVLLGALLLVLVVSNATWFFYADRPTSIQPQETVVVEPTILKQGVEFKSQPPSRVVKVKDGSREEIGSTPIHLSPSLGGGQLDVEFESAGYRNAKLRIEESGGGYSVIFGLESE